ncbi:MAG TPA: hypothetical protein VHZ29_14950 [Rhizomicrobium sp.]|jgi:hypothetical protein|nr:hypothetical protein [Rhizomicrobium sp.]
MLKVAAERKLDDDSLANKRHAVVAPNPALSPEERLVAQLRHEANQEKDAFGWHAFQALSISAVALGGILYFMFADKGDLSVGLGALPILAFVLVTCRLGDSCYSSANRHYGYELFLYRVRPDSGNGGTRWKSEYRKIEWEAAMRAWRVVQATLFEAIYFPGKFPWPDKPRPPFQDCDEPFWFRQRSLTRESGATFHAGTYLQSMHTILLLAGFASVVILWIAALGFLLHPQIGIKGVGDATRWLNFLVDTAMLFIAVLATWLLRIRQRAERSKRSIMEDGLLSIHSSSVAWQAVVLAHFSAAERAQACGLTSWKLVELARYARKKHPQQWRKWRAGTPFEDLLEVIPEKEKGERDQGAGITGYTFWLSEEAASLGRCAAVVPGWIGVGERRLRDRGLVK